MYQENREFYIEKSKELMAAPSCCQEAKDAAQAWMDAIGTDQESAAFDSYIAELKEDVTGIDGLIAFAESDMGKKVFGDAAEGIAAHAREIQVAGAKYCDCPACAAGAAILEKNA